MRRLRLSYCLVVLCFAFAHSANPTRATSPSDQTDTCLRIGSYSDYGQEAISIASTYVSRMYEVAGLCLTYVVMPAKRSSELLLAGQLDGELLRAGIATQIYGDTAYVIPQAILEFSIKMVWLEDGAFTGNVSDLPNFKVVRLAGDLFTEQVLGMRLPNSIQLQGLDSIAELLLRRRADVLLANTLTARFVEESMPSGSPALKVADARHVQVFHVLHNRHRDKAEALMLAYKLMLQRGDMLDLSKKHGVQLPKIIE